MVAAAVLLVSRKSRGLAPYWPTALHSLTGYSGVRLPTPQAVVVLPVHGSCLACCGPASAGRTPDGEPALSPPVRPALPPPSTRLQGTPELAAAIAGAQRLQDGIKREAAAAAAAALASLEPLPAPMRDISRT